MNNVEVVWTMDNRSQFDLWKLSIGKILSYEKNSSLSFTVYTNREIEPLINQHVDRKLNGKVSIKFFSSSLKEISDNAMLWWVYSPLLSTTSSRYILYLDNDTLPFVKDIGKMVEQNAKDIVTGRKSSSTLSGKTNFKNILEQESIWSRLKNSNRHINSGVVIINKKEFKEKFGNTTILNDGIKRYMVVAKEMQIKNIYDDEALIFFLLKERISSGLPNKYNATKYSMKEKDVELLKEKSDVIVHYQDNKAKMLSEAE